MDGDQVSKEEKKHFHGLTSYGVRTNWNIKSMTPHSRYDFVIVVPDAWWGAEVLGLPFPLY